jgi:hypothetical protein
MSSSSQKTVGVRVAALAGWTEVDQLLKTAAEVRGVALVPKGVYRFSTFEEAHTWMVRATARTHAHHASMTSHGSAGR